MGEGVGDGGRSRDAWPRHSPRAGRGGGSGRPANRIPPRARPAANPAPRRQGSAGRPIRGGTRRVKSAFSRNLSPWGPDTALPPREVPGAAAGDEPTASLMASRRAGLVEQADANAVFEAEVAFCTATSPSSARARVQTAREGCFRDARRIPLPPVGPGLTRVEAGRIIDKEELVTHRSGVYSAMPPERGTARDIAPNQLSAPFSLRVPGRQEERGEMLVAGGKGYCTGPACGLFTTGVRSAPRSNQVVRSAPGLARQATRDRSPNLKRPARAAGAPIPHPGHAPRSPRVYDGWLRHDEQARQRGPLHRGPPPPRGQGAVCGVPRPFPPAGLPRVRGARLQDPRGRHRLGEGAQ